MLIYFRDLGKSASVCKLTIGIKTEVLLLIPSTSVFNYPVRISLVFFLFFPLYHVCSLSFAFLKLFNVNLFMGQKKNHTRWQNTLQYFRLSSICCFSLPKKRNRMEKCLVCLFKVCFFLALLYYIHYGILCILSF